MDNKRVEDFLENICNQISQEEVAKEVYLEMKDHVETMAEEYIEDGIEKEEAIEKALYNMGDPTKIGYGINSSHNNKKSFIDRL